MFGNVKIKPLSIFSYCFINNFNLILYQNWFQLYQILLTRSKGSGACSSNYFIQIKLCTEKIKSNITSPDKYKQLESQDMFSMKNNIIIWTRELYQARRVIHPARHLREIILFTPWPCYLLAVVVSLGHLGGPSWEQQLLETQPLQQWQGLSLED